MCRICVDGRKRLANTSLLFQKSKNICRDATTRIYFHVSIEYLPDKSPVNEAIWILAADDLRLIHLTFYVYIIIILNIIKFIDFSLEKIFWVEIGNSVGHVHYILLGAFRISNIGFYVQ